MQTLSSAILDTLEHLHRHGAPFDYDAAMVLSGAAFRHYLFTPEDNHAWLVENPGEHWRDDSLRLENYGAFEAIQGHTGWSGRRWDKLKGAELVQLLRYESAENRLARLQGVGFITNVEASRAGLRLTIDRGGETHELTHGDLSTLDDFCAGLPTLWTLRKEPGEIPAARRHALTGDVLRWAWNHYTSRKEIVHDTDAFYATGRRAWELLQALSETLRTPPDDRDVEGGYAYIDAHVRELAIAREAAARFFEDPALLLEHTGREALSSPQIDGIARAWGAVAEALRAVEDAPRDATTEALRRAADADEIAFETLRAFAG